jgi:hypothetical protein
MITTKNMKNTLELKLITEVLMEAMNQTPAMKKRAVSVMMRLSI